jgi:hypothetical protein
MRTARSTAENFGVMAGSTTRFKIAETNGYCSRTPTPEDIRDNAARILDEEAIAGAGLTFGSTAGTP